MGLTMTHSHIPLEIADLVLENTYTPRCFYINLSKQEIGTLASCALVCRSWRPFAQRRLFEHVWLDLKSKHLDQFLACLESSPHIAAATRLLCIYFTGSREDDHQLRGNEDKPEEHQVSPVLLMKIAAKLSSRAQLKLEAFTLLGWPSDTPLPTAPVRLHTLGVFGLQYIPFLRPQSTTFDLTSFFELDHIHLASNRMLDTTNTTATSDVLVSSTATRPVARSINLINNDCFATCSLECGGFYPGSLQTVRLTPRDFASLQLAGMLLRRHADSIRDVHVDVSYDMLYTTELGSDSKCHPPPRSRC